MKFIQRPYINEDDFWLMRQFLREVFLLNDRLESSWHVARLDYWRWHLIENCSVCTSVAEATSLWETQDHQLAGFITPLGNGEVRLHTHPTLRSFALLESMLEQAEAHNYCQDKEGQRWVYTPLDTGDTLLEQVLLHRGFNKQAGISHKYRRDLTNPLPIPAPVPGYEIRSMGGPEEHSARSWASWRAFHSDEPDDHYDGDYSWINNLQSAPLYRRDLDIVAVAPTGEIAAFTTIYYDDYTRAAVFVLVGTAAEHWQRGLGKAVLLEGMRRLERLGCIRAFATAYDPPANALYRAMFKESQIAETWLKQDI